MRMRGWFGGSLGLALIATAYGGAAAANVTIEWRTMPIWWSGITGTETQDELAQLKAAGKPATWADYMVAQFEAQNPGVTINHTSMDWNVDPLLTSLAAGAGPDVFYVYPTLFQQLAAGHALHPIDAYLTAQDKQEFYPIALQFSDQGGQHYLWPWLIVAEGDWAVNKTLFQNAGIDNLLPTAEAAYSWTYDQFLAATRKAVAAGGKNVFGFNLAGTFADTPVNTWFNWSFLYGSGGDFWDAAANSVTPTLQESLQQTFGLFADLAKESLVGPGDFRAGSLVYQVGDGSLTYKAIQQQYGSFKSAPFEPMLANPPAAAGHQFQVGAGSVAGWVLNASLSGEKLQWAAKFARFLTEKQQELTINFGIPARRTATAEYVTQRPVAAWQVQYSIPYIKLGPSGPKVNDVLAVWQEEGRGVVAGDLSPAQAAADYTKRVNALLAEVK